VLDAVGDGLLSADGETVVLVAVWVDPPRTTSSPCGREPRRDARAVRRALEGPAARAVEGLLAQRGTATNAFWGGTS
jgi:hypothetical protein